MEEKVYKDEPIDYSNYLKRKIKPCPKCGSKGKVHEIGSAIHPTKYFVMCESIGCPVYTRNYDTRREAIETWNNLKYE